MRLSQQPFTGATAQLFMDKTAGTAWCRGSVVTGELFYECCSEDC
jgi:hypothetical protein